MFVLSIICSKKSGKIILDAAFTKATNKSICSKFIIIRMYNYDFFFSIEISSSEKMFAFRTQEKG